MQQVTIQWGQVVPLVVKPGEYIKINTSALAAGTIAIAGEAVADTVAASSGYAYGGFTAQREVVIKLTSGYADVMVEGGAPPVEMGRNPASSFANSILDTASLAAVRNAAGGPIVGARVAPALAAASIAPKLPKFVAAVRSAIQAGLPAIVLIDGDSTEAGYGTGTSGTNNFVGARKASHTAQLARMLGWQDSGFLGCGAGTDVTITQYDERLSIGTGITVLASNTTALGGSWVSINNGATGVLTVTPRGSRGYDRVRVIWGKKASGGATSLTVSVGGTSVGTFSGNGADGVFSQDFTCNYSSPSTNITIGATSGTADGQVFIIGVLWWDSTNPGVIVLNGGASGAKVADKLSTGNPWTAFAAIPVLAPHLVIANLWINDTQYVTAPATYKTQLQSYNTMAAASADVVWMGWQVINNVNATNGQGDAIFAQMASVAATNGQQIIDLRNVFGSDYSAMNALGIFFDTAHLTAKGQYYKACYTASLLAI